MSPSFYKVVVEPWLIQTRLDLIATHAARTFHTGSSVESEG